MANKVTFTRNNDYAPLTQYVYEAPDGITYVAYQEPDPEHYAYGMWILDRAQKVTGPDGITRLAAAYSEEFEPQPRLKDVRAILEALYVNVPEETRLANEAAGHEAKRLSRQDIESAKARLAKAEIALDKAIKAYDVAEPLCDLALDAGEISQKEHDAAIWLLKSRMVGDCRAEWENAVSALVMLGCLYHGSVQGKDWIAYTRANPDWERNVHKAGHEARYLYLEELWRNL